MCAHLKFQLPNKLCYGRSDLPRRSSQWGYSLCYLYIQMVTIGKVI